MLYTVIYVCYIGSHGKRYVAAAAAAAVEYVAWIVQSNTQCNIHTIVHS